MLVHLRPQPEILYCSQGRTVMATERNGCIGGGAEHGLFVHQTRLLSRYRYLIDGNVPEPVALSNVEQHTLLGYYIRTLPGIEVEHDEGSGALNPASQETLELRVSRFVGDGVHEDLDFTNWTQSDAEFELALEIDADFAGQLEARTVRRQHGEIGRHWQTNGAGDRELAFDYTAENPETGARIHRGVTLRFEHASSVPSWHEGRVRFQVRLAPHGRWHCCVSMVPLIDGTVMEPRYGCHSFSGRHGELDTRRHIFLAEATRFDASPCPNLATVVEGALRQSKEDLASLRLYDLDSGERAWTMAAGMPLYAALYGRDVLTTAWQAALLGPDMMKGTLPEVARRQGTQYDDWRDEQPGRMLHEAHTGPAEILGYNPRARYYGSITTSGFYPVVVSQLWHWTGKKELVEPLIEPALGALRWLDTHADLDGDGFYEYQTRSHQGTRHQAWKDSPDAIVHADGSQVPPPIATCEEQGFVYLGKLLLSEILWRMGRKDEARRLFRAARELKKRFNDAFWMEEEGFFAMGLDPQKRPIRSIGSNPGHCLATGIVDRSLVRKTAGRLMAADMFSGWGIRTLSSEHPAYNPFSYHRGSVWPVEQGTFALAFLRYGLWGLVHSVAGAQFETAALFEHYRLPEAFSGHRRDAAHPFPGFYPQSNAPQAWSASAIFCLLQSMLGIFPYAPLNSLFVDPHLPDWLPEITLRGLRVGDAVVSIRFFRRKNGRSSYKVLNVEGRLHVIRQPSPWSLTAGMGERVEDTLGSLLPWG